MMLSMEIAKRDLFINGEILEMGKASKIIVDGVDAFVHRLRTVMTIPCAISIIFRCVRIRRVAQQWGH